MKKREFGSVPKLWPMFTSYTSLLSTASSASFSSSCSSSPRNIRKSSSSSSVFYVPFAEALPDFPLATAASTDLPGRPRFGKQKPRRRNSRSPPLKEQLFDLSEQDAKEKSKSEDTASEISWTNSRHGDDGFNSGELQCSKQFACEQCNKRSDALLPGNR